MLHVEILYWSFKFDEIGEVNAGSKFRFGMANVFSRGGKEREKKRPALTTRQFALIRQSGPNHSASFLAKPSRQARRA